MEDDDDGDRDDRDEELFPLLSRMSDEGDDDEVGDEELISLEESFLSRPAVITLPTKVPD